MTGSQLKHSRYFNTLIQGTKIEGSKGLFHPAFLTLTCTASKLNLSLMTVGLGILYDISQDRPVVEKNELFTEAKAFAEFCAGGGEFDWWSLEFCCDRR